MDNYRKAQMKHSGVKAKVIVIVRESADGSTVVLYRGGKNGLAFRSPFQRVLRDAARQRSRGGAIPSAARTHQQGGSQ